MSGDFQPSDRMRRYALTHAAILNDPPPILKNPAPATQKATAAAAGVAESTVSRWFRRDGFAEWLDVEVRRLTNTPPRCSIGSRRELALVNAELARIDEEIQRGIEGLSK
jgi:hypothetical protein